MHNSCIFSTVILMNSYPELKIYFGYFNLYYMGIIFHSKYIILTGLAIKGDHPFSISFIKQTIINITQYDCVSSLYQL